MSLRSVEQLRERTSTLRSKLADKASSMDGAQIRALKKRIRRHQRRRRSLEATAKRLASGEKEEKQEG